MTVVGDAILAELERKGQQTEAQAITASPIQAGERFLGKVVAPASMEVQLEPEGPLPATHTVAKGETLSAIARRHGTTWQELAKINKLEDPNALRPGQTLRVPSGEATSAGSTTVTVPIDSAVTWQITRDSGDAQEGQDYVLVKPAPAQTGGTWEHTVDALLAPAIVALTAPPTDRPVRWFVKPAVTLTARPDKVPQLSQLGEEPQSTEADVPALPVDVTALAVPSVVAAFSETKYNTTSNKARLVIVPVNVPVVQEEGRVDNVEGLVKTLMEVQGVLRKLTGLARLAAFATGLDTGLGLIVETLRAHDVGSNHKLVFKRLNETRDLGQVESDWRDRGWQDDHGAEDDIDSLLMVSIDQVLELYRSQDFRDTQVIVEPSPSQFWIGIPEFSNIKGATPGDARVTTSVSSFGDQAHSLRFRPRG